MADLRDLIQSRKSNSPKDWSKYDWQAIARASQLAPPGKWSVWLILAGRGWGKTLTGAQWVRRQVEHYGRRRLALVGRTPYDVRDVMIEGQSGILAISRPDNRPKYEPSKRRLTWPNGAIATAYSSVEPDQLRGPQHDGAWGDEVAAWEHDETLVNLMLGLRLGSDPRVVFTTTPKPVKHLHDLLVLPSAVVTRGSTYENLDNLAPTFRDQIISRYEGTRIGRQELDGELLEDIEGALFTYDLIDAARVREAPDLKRIVVAIDPAVSANEGSDETGIIVAGLGYNGHAYILEDLSGRFSPDTWARRAVDAYHRHKADRVVAEVNNGGALVQQTIRTVEPSISYKAVHASRGKAIRAEPIAALYEQGKVHHVGIFNDLETQMAGWVPGDKNSPDRLDALVWALTEVIPLHRGTQVA